MGLGGYYGHYQGHWLSAMAFLYNNTLRDDIKQRGADFVAMMARAQDAWGARYPSEKGYLFPYDIVVFQMLEQVLPMPNPKLYRCDCNDECVSR